MAVRMMSWRMVRQQATARRALGGVRGEAPAAPPTDDPPALHRVVSEVEPGSEYPGIAICGCQRVWTVLGGNRNLVS
jgi:hypothetical protein